MTTIVIASVLLAGCAVLRETPPSVHPSPYVLGWTEAIVDPGSMPCENCCGATVFKTMTMFLVRHISCTYRREKTRQHEACHAILGPSAAAIKLCHDTFVGKD